MKFCRSNDKNEENVKKDKFSKIIYFDKESIEDLIYMDNKGKLEKLIIEGNKKSKKGKIFGKFNFGNKKRSNLGLNTNIGYDYNNDQLSQQVIINTVLTDYFELISSDEGEKMITKLKKVSIHPYTNSIAYVKFITPYLGMIKGFLETDQENLNIDIQKIDEALNNGKGYFEMVLEDNTKVLRFNLKSFKNSYTLFDLINTTLSYHAVKVGEMKLRDLNMKKMFYQIDDKKDIDIAKISEYGDLDKNKVEVYDVLLAGVEYD